MKTENNDSLNERNLTGGYANYFKVGYNAFEFVFDFGQYYPENENAEITTRLITNPTYAKTFLKVLRDSIDQYEQIHGIIKAQEKDTGSEA